MKNCAIIGGGQLGSRHLQGLLTSKSNTLTIFVVDPSEETLKVCESRANEVEHNHTVFYLQDQGQLPKQIDFVIIATNSKVRFQVMSLLLTKSEVTYLLLEKVLFNDLEAYELASELIKGTKTKVWVNHPRRVFDSYINLKKQHLKPNHKLFFQIVGSQWGLACNGLHFIDFIEFLTSSTLLRLDISNLDNVIHQSKREGYIEMTGTLLGTLENGSQFSITSLDGPKIIAPAISIMSTEQRFYIQEGNKSFIKKFDIESNFEELELPFKMEFQSGMTGRIFDQLMLEGICQLPTFEHSKQTHEIFINALLSHYQKDNFSESKTLPIT